MSGACRDCAQPGFGGPAENRFTAYDAVCASPTGCRDAGYPQIYVNTADLTLFVRVTDLAFGGGFVLERSFNMDDATRGGFGIGWSFSLGDTLTPDSDGTLVLRRGSGRVDRFVTAAGGQAYFAVTGTGDTLVKASDGSYALSAAGSAASRLFTAKGKLSAIREAGVTRVSLDYDSSGRLATARYRGRAITFTSDSSGNITRIADAAGRSVSFTYTDGRLTQQTNADGSATAYEYDGAGNLTAVTFAGARFAIAYTGDAPYSSVASVITPNSATKKYDIPRAPVEIRVTDGNGDAALYASNPSGLLQSITDAAGNVTSYGYDGAGNRVRATNAAGESISLTYNAAGMLTAISDAANHRWTADYSGGLLTRITDPNKNIWSFQYDDAGNLVSATNPAGGSVTATRNAQGQIALVTGAKGNKTAYEYGTDGLLSAFTDPLNNKWSYEYDAAARPSARTDPSGTLRAGYDTQNRIASLSAGDVNTAFDYSGVKRDSLKHVVSYTDSFGNQIAYSYDAAGQLISMTLPGDKTVTYGYDHARRLSKVADWAGNIALYRYDAAGYAQSVTVSGGPVTIYQYDAARNLTAVVSTGPDGAPVAGYRYTFDANGNRTGVSALEPYANSYTIAAYTLSVDAANRPVSRSDGQTYEYDARGNLTAIRGTRAATAQYDAFGRLQSFAAANTTFYSYDATGLRVTRSDRRLVWDVSGARPRMVMETDGAGAPVAWYVYGLGLLWKVTADGTPYFYHFDGDGNAVALSNPALGVVNQYQYDSLGRLAAFNERVDNPFRARAEAGWLDDGNGLLFTGGEFQFPELRVSLPSSADPSPPTPDIRPHLGGAGACFFEGVANCQFAAGRRER